MKFLKTTALILAGASSLSAASLSGYVGGSVGSGFSKLDVAHAKSKNKANLFINAYTGLGFLFQDSYYLGFEIGGNTDTSNRTQTSLKVGSDAESELTNLFGLGAYSTPGAPTKGAISMSYQLKKAYGFSGAPRIGYNFGTLLAYVKPGVEYSSYTYKSYGEANIAHTVTGVVVSHKDIEVVEKKKNKVAFVPSVGLEQTFDIDQTLGKGKAVLRGEYTFARSNIAQGIKNTDHRLLVGAGYQF